MNEQLTSDMQRHFTHKIRVVMHDIGTTCEAMDVDKNDIVSLLVSSLIYEVVRMSVGIGLDQNGFAAAMAQAWRDLAPAARRELKIASKRK